MGIDIFLYVALLAGYVAGRFIPNRGRWLANETMTTVVALVFFLGAEFGANPGPASWTVVPVAFAFLLLILFFTLAILRLLPYRRLRSEASALPAVPGIPFGVVLVASLLLGIVVGKRWELPSATLLTLSLYILLGLVGFDLRLSRRALANAWAPVAAAVGGATVAAVGWSALAGLPPAEALATAYGFGFYSLAGPVVASQAGPSIGILAFLVNFFRENLTMLLSPRLGGTLGAEGLTAMGGATSMDTTLYFIVRFGDPEAASLALAAGLILTLVASLTLPLILGVPGA